MFPNLPCFETTSGHAPHEVHRMRSAAHHEPVPNMLPVGPRTVGADDDLKERPGAEGDGGPALRVQRAHPLSARKPPFAPTGKTEQRSFF